MNSGPRNPHWLCGPVTLGLPRGCWGEADRGRGQAAWPRAPSPTWRDGEGWEARAPRVGEPRARTALPPLPPPGPRRQGFAHSAAGKCYFSGKVSAGTARIPAAAAPGPLGLFSFARPAASRGVGPPPDGSLAPGAAPSAPRPRVPGARPPPRGRGRWERRRRPALPFPARRVARAYLCGPGRSRGRHPVV